MSTRGLYGIRKNGIDKLTYNHAGSYPGWLGLHVVEFCKRNTKEQLERFYHNIELVDESAKPSKDQIRICKNAGYFNDSVSHMSDTDWYCLLRNLVGKFGEYQRLLDQEKTIFMIESSSFIKDSLFCEYAYIINLDEGVLEYYEGFQKKPQSGNRYGTTPRDGYFPCKLVLSFPLEELRLADPKDIVAKMETHMSEEDTKMLEYLKKDMSEDDALEVLKAFGAERITPNSYFLLYDTIADYAKERIEDIYDIDYRLISYVNLNGFGADLLNDEVYERLDSGKIAILSEN